MRLPTEQKEYICIFLKFENTIYLSNYISKKKFDKSRFNWNYAVEYGYLKLLYDNRKEGLTYAINYADENCHFEIVKWLADNRSEGCTWAMFYAAQNSHLEVIKWLHENRIEGCTTYAMNYAAHNDHLDVVEYLKNKIDLKK